MISLLIVNRWILLCGYVEAKCPLCLTVKLSVYLLLQAAVAAAQTNHNPIKYDAL